ncbi:MAG: DUF507 family protein [Myxococcales bacterium]|nr:DUF507 family protein [Myxococcales bacterium]
MRLYGSRVPAIAKDIIKELTDRELIEVSAENVEEVEEDAKSVLNEYLRAERRLTDEAKDMARQRGLDYAAHGKIKRQIADKRRFGLYEDAVGYIANQLIELLLHTPHVDEIFAEDHELRRAVAPVLRRHMAAADGIEAEVRKRVKNLNEGTREWEIRYQQELERLQQLQNLTDD